MATVNAIFEKVYIGEPCTLTLSHEVLNSTLTTHTLSFRFSITGESETYEWTPTSSELVAVTREDEQTVYRWTPPASIARYIPTRLYANGIFTVTDTNYFRGQYVNTTVYTFPFVANIPDSMSPTLTMEVTPVSENAKLTEWGIFVKGMTKAQYTLRASGQHGATIKSYNFSVGGHTMTQASGTTPLLTSATPPNAMVTDSRGKVATTWEAVTIYDYSSPTFRDTVEYRCDADGTPNSKGSYLRVQCSAACYPLGGRNEVTVRARYRVQGGTYGAYNTLAQGVETVIATGLVATSVYEVELSAIDTVGSVTAVSFTGDNGRIAMHMRDGGDGVAFGKKCTEAGFACAWDAKFDGKVGVTGEVSAASLKVGGKSLLDLVYPVGAVYISLTNTNPANLFGGTWAAIEGKFLLSANTSYAAGSTGGAATHKITVAEMPSHTHSLVGGYTDEADTGHNHLIPNIRTGASGEYGAYAESWGNGSGSREMETGYTGMSHTHDVYGTSAATGGSTAMSIMPPYLAVYMWKRTA